MPSTSHSGSASSAKRRRLLRRGRGDVVLEDVHDLVAEDVIVLRVVAGERQDDAVHERVGEAARALADHAAGGGGLVEVGGVRVEDDRLLRKEWLKTRESRAYQRSAMRPMSCTTSASCS